MHMLSHLTLEINPRGHSEYWCSFTEEETETQKVTLSQNEWAGTSLVVQWLRFHLLLQRVQAQSLVWGNKTPYALWSKAQKADKKNRSNIKTNSIKIKKKKKQPKSKTLMSRKVAIWPRLFESRALILSYDISPSHLGTEIMMTHRNRSIYKNLDIPKIDFQSTLCKGGGKREKRGGVGNHRC